MSSDLCFEIKAWDGRSFRLSLSGPRSVTVQSIKPLIELQLGIAIDRQELVFHDTTSQLLLHDQAILREEYGTTGELRVRRNVRSISIRVAYGDAHEDLECSSQEKIGTVKSIVAERFAVSAEGKILSFEARDCSDDSTLCDCNVLHNSVLHMRDPSVFSQLIVKRMTGKTITIHGVTRHTTISEIKRRLFESEGILQYEQRLLLAGNQLEDDRRLGDYNIQNDSILDLAESQSGMISSFTHSDLNDPLVHYLMLPEEERRTTPIPLEHFLERQALHRADDETFHYDANCFLLSTTYRAVIEKFLDFMWRHEMDDVAVDMKVALRGDLLAQLLMPFAARCNNLHVEANSSQETFKSLSSKGEIVLRMTKGPTNACINFHTDGNYARYTQQIALNGPAEYEGGKLCYFTQGRLHVLERPAGSIVGHVRSILHGVTALSGGVRKSLFLLDNLVDPALIEASKADVDNFWRSDMSSLCSYCHVNFPEQNCGSCDTKTVLCNECQQVFGACPRCRIVQLAHKHESETGQIPGASKKRRIDQMK